MEFIVFFIIIIILLVLSGKVSALSVRVKSLEQTVRRLQGRIQTLEPPAGTITPPAAAPRPLPQAQAPSAPSIATGTPSRTREEWEALVGGKLLNRIGAFALILAMAFFLKYAFDNDWLNETMRVLIGGVVGAVLIGGGVRFHQKELQVFAQGLLGAGIAILYLSVYASFDFYQLVSQPVAFVLMSVVTLTAFLLALRYNAQVISLLGWAGGFLTPFLLSTGEVNTVGLFTYITLLDIGLVGVLIRRPAWNILEPLTVGATYAVYIAWYTEVLPSDYVVTVFVFLSIFWGLFTLLHLSRVLSGAGTFPRMHRMVAVLNAAFYYLSIYALIDDTNPDVTAVVTLAVGLVYFGILLAIQPQTHDRLAQAHYGLTAIILLVIATALQFSDVTTVAVWSLEALALLWCGVFWGRSHVWQTALALFLLTAVKLCYTEGALLYEPIEQFANILNSRTPAFLILAGTLIASTLVFRTVSEEETARIRKLLRVGWCVTLFVWCTAETNDAFRHMLDTVLSEDDITWVRNMQQLAISGMWLCYAIIIMGIGMWRREQVLRVMAITFFGFAILKIFFYDLSFLEALFRIFSFISLGLILLIVSYLYQRYRDVIAGITDDTDII